MRLPDFLIIGAMRAGTTALHRSLSAHPEIGMPREKETDFFIENRTWRRGLTWYCSLFPDLPVVGEASPNYTKRDSFPGIPERVASTCADIKLIYVVRNPLDRFLSQYRQRVAMGGLKRGEITEHEYTHILNTGLYTHQLSAWLEHFERERILIVDHSDLRKNPGETLNSVQTFLGVTPRDLPTESHNTSAELATLPPAVMRLSRFPPARALARVIPAAARDVARRGLARKHVAPVDPPPGTLERVAPALAEDATSFRKLTGLGFSSWTL